MKFERYAEKSFFEVANKCAGTADRKVKQKWNSGIQEAGIVKEKAIYTLVLKELLRRKL